VLTFKAGYVSNAAAPVFQKRAQKTAPFANYAKPCMLAEQFSVIVIAVLMLFSLYGLQQDASKKIGQFSVR
jgi:hypothetical protein